MKKSNKSLIVLLLAVLVSLCSCSRNKETVVLNMDVHPVTDIEFSDYENEFDFNHEEIDEFFQTTSYETGFDFGEEGAYRICSLNNLIYIQEYDANKMLVNTVKATLNKSFIVYSVERINDAEMIACACDYEGDFYLLRFYENQVMEYVNFGKLNVSDIKTTQSGDVFIIGRNENDVSLYKLDSGYQIETKYSSDNSILDFDVVDDILYVLEYEPTDSSSQSYCMHVIGLSADSKMKEISDDSMVYETQYMSNRLLASIYAINKDEVVLSFDSGIVAYNLDSKSSRILANTQDFGIEVPCDVFRSSDNTLLAIGSYYDVRTDSISESLMQISINENSNNKEEITVGVFDSLYYEDCFYAYNRATKDSYIKLTNYSFTANDTSDYITLINNSDDLDMVVFDNSLYDEFTYSELLMDLTGSGIDESCLYEANGSSSKYCLTPSYYISALLFNDSLYEKANLTLEEISMSNPEKLFPYAYLEDLAQTIYGLIQNDINSSGKVTDSTIEEFLRLCQRYSETDTSEMTMPQLIKTGRLLSNNVDIFYIDALYSYYCYYADGLGIAPTWGYENTVIKPCANVGIYADTDNKETCIEILNYILSEEIQDTMPIPANKKSLQNVCDAFVNGFTSEKGTEMINTWMLRSQYDNANELNFSDKYYSIDSDILTDEQTEEYWSRIESLPDGVVLRSDKEDLEYVARLFEELVTSSIKISEPNDEIVKMMIDEAELYINGKEDLTTAKNNLTNSINTYIAERYN